MKKLIVDYSLKGIVISIFVVFSLNAQAQFEQKLTLNASGVGVLPHYIAENPIYNIGWGLDGGIQFNANNYFSLTSSARYYLAWSLQDFATNMDNIAFGAGFKLNMLPTKAINPYIFAEGNINFIWGYTWYSYDEPFIDEFGVWVNGYYDEDWYTDFGGLGGLGFDINFGKNFSVFIQGGAYYMIYESTMDIYSQLGIRINLIKSKRI